MYNTLFLSGKQHSEHTQEVLYTLYVCVCMQICVCNFVYVILCYYPVANLGGFQGFPFWKCAHPKLINDRHAGDKISRICMLYWKSFILSFV